MEEVVFDFNLPSSKKEEGNNFLKIYRIHKVKKNKKNKNITKANKIQNC